ncbi:MAG: hypothetical protein ABI045_00525 [Flavobacteriales bacterium]
MRKLKEEKVGLEILAKEFRYFNTEHNAYLYKEGLPITLDIAFVKKAITNNIYIAESNEIKAVFWIHPQNLDLNIISKRNILSKYIKNHDQL